MDKIQSNNYYYVAVGVDNGIIKDNRQINNTVELIKHSIEREIDDINLSDINYVDVEFNNQTDEIKKLFNSKRIQHVQEYKIQINDNINISSDKIEKIVCRCLEEVQFNMEESRSKMDENVTIGK